MLETLYDFGVRNRMDFASLDIIADVLERRLINYSLAIKNCLRKLKKLEKTVRPIETSFKFNDWDTFEVSKVLGMSVPEHTLTVYLVKTAAYRGEPAVQKTYLRMCLSLLVDLKQRHLICLNPWDTKPRGKRFYETILEVVKDFDQWAMKINADLEELFDFPNQEDEDESD